MITLAHIFFNDSTSCARRVQYTNCELQETYLNVGMNLYIELYILIQSGRETQQRYTNKVVLDLYNPLHSQYCGVWWYLWTFLCLSVLKFPSQNGICNFTILEATNHLAKVIFARLRFEVSQIWAHSTNPVLGYVGEIPNRIGLYHYT